MIANKLRTSPADGYVLPRSSTEYDRLREQARIYEQATRRVLERAGLGTGMSCLDVGCGPGAVMEIMGELVGATGHVVGVDIDRRAGLEGLRRLRSNGNNRYAFFEHDLTSQTPFPGGPYDVTFARFVLIHLTDPLALLRKMYEATRPGGAVVVQDSSFAAFDIQPRPRGWNVVEKCLFGVFEETGKDPCIGDKLPAHFVAAGIGMPDGTDIHRSTMPFTEYGEHVLGVIRGLQPRAVQLGLTTEAESRACFDEFNEMIGSDRAYTYRSPHIVGAWKTKTLGAG
jgi:ubiquinone/menaquinone biosynthesis C-methylase UbiE